MAYTHGSRCLQCACHISPSHPLHYHVSSAVFAVPARSLRDHILVCTVFAELVPIRTARAAGSLATWPIQLTMYTPWWSTKLKRMELHGQRSWRAYVFRRGRASTTVAGTMSIALQFRVQTQNTCDVLGRGPLHCK